MIRFKFYIQGRAGEGSNLIILTGEHRTRGGEYGVKPRWEGWKEKGLVTESSKTINKEEYEKTKSMYSSGLRYLIQG